MALGECVQVPVGTHSWEKFVTPEEMALLLRRAGLQVRRVADRDSEDSDSLLRVICHR